MGTFKDLLVYQKSLNFVEMTYSLTKKFPLDEKFGLTNQLRRALVSIPSNIAEGSQRRTKKELLQFLFIAYGSLAEVETQLELCRRFGYISTAQVQKTMNDHTEISKMLRAYIRKIQESNDLAN